MVYGLKRVEGRVWNSRHRGALWIHAASREPEAGEIEGYEDFYRRIYALDATGQPADAQPLLPSVYPTSCLVGIVNVVDVVPADQFATWDALPAGARAEGDANGSDFFFLCEGQRRLPLPLKMPGQHKLWHLQDQATASALLDGGLPAEQLPINFIGYRELGSATSSPGTAGGHEHQRRPTGADAFKAGSTAFVPNAAAASSCADES
eukprot:5981796-Prymnesium_polylepis.1